MAVQPVEVERSMADRSVPGDRVLQGEGARIRPAFVVGNS